jgi:hypothetical protein
MNKHKDICSFIPSNALFTIYVVWTCPHLLKNKASNANFRKRTANKTQMKHENAQRHRQLSLASIR